MGRARHSRSATSLLALAALCAAAAGQAQTPGGEDRVETRTAVTDPARVPAGEFFKLHDTALAWQLPGEVAAALAGNEALLRTWSADRLAQEYLDAADGAASDAITVGMLRAAASGAGSEKPLLAAARNTVAMPDGHRLALPVARSYGMHLWLMRAAATARSAQGEARVLPERLDAAVQGDCPFSAGPVTLAQRGFVVEGRRGGRLLLQGALGADEAWFAAVEPRYMTTVRVGNRLVELRVPDRPSAVYRAALAGPALRLQAAGGAARCEITLQPAA